jgi:hypothetical protein
MGAKSIGDGSRGLGGPLKRSNVVLTVDLPVTLCQTLYESESESESMLSTRLHLRDMKDDFMVK